MVALPSFGRPVIPEANRPIDDTLLQLLRLETACQHFTKKGNFQYILPLSEKILELSDQWVGQTELRNHRWKYYFTGLGYLHQGNALQSELQYAKALERYGRAEQFLKEIRLEKKLGSVYNNTGVLYYALGELPLALHFHRKALASRIQLGNPGYIGDSYNSIAWILAEQGLFTASLSAHKKAISFRAQQPGNELGVANSLNNIGTVYAGMGAWDMAQKYYEGAYKLFLKHQFKLGEVYYHTNMGDLLVAQEERREALAHYYLAMSKLNKEKDKKVWADIQLNLGTLFLNEGDIELAEKHFRYAGEVYLSLGDLGRQQQYYSKLAKLAQQRNDWLLAESYLKKALVLAQKTQHIGGEAEAHFELGTIYEKKNQPIVAERHWLSGLGLSQRTGKHALTCKFYLALGQVNQTQPQLGLSWALRGLAIAREHQLKLQIKESLDLLGNLYEHLHETQKSVSSKQEAQQLGEALTKEKYDRQLAFFRQKLDAQKQDDRIRWLQQDAQNKLAKIQRQKIEIGFGIFVFSILFLGSMWLAYSIWQKRSAQSREKIVQSELRSLRFLMNHHFTFNVLNSIQYFIRSNETENADYYIGKFAELLRLVLDQSQNTFIPLSEEIRLIELYVTLEEMRFERTIDFSIHGLENFDYKKMLIPGMLIQPLIENAVKHGLAYKKGEARIAIYFTSLDKKLICRVEDNGVGRTVAAHHRVSENHTAKGLPIIKDRIRLLSELFHMNLNYQESDVLDAHGQVSGTAIQLEFPISLISYDHRPYSR
jgi:tetratricopeptide (TPR) repeat protein